MRGLNTKLCDFYVNASHSDYDVIAISETWCSPAVHSSELIDTSLYTVFRCDRDFDALGVGRGGGVMLAVKNSLKPLPVDMSKISDSLPRIDITGCRLSLYNSSSLILIVVYVQSGASLDDYAALFEYLELTEILYDRNVVVLGDFNITNYYAVVDVGFSADPRCELLLAFLDFFDYRQMNFVRNGRDHILDLIMTNVNCEVCRASDPFVPEDSHHPALLAFIDIQYVADSVFSFNDTLEDYNFRKADLVGLYGGLAAVNWDFLSSTESVDEACGMFYDTLYSLFDRFVPRVRNTSHSKFPVWYSGSIIRKLSIKNKLFKKFKVTKSEFHLTRYKDIRREIKGDVRAAYGEYLNRTQYRLRSDPKAFWSFVNAKRRTSRIPGEMCLNGNVLDTPQSVVDGFADYFNSVYIQHTNIDPPDASVSPPVRCDVQLVTAEEVLLHAGKLKNGFTCGPDGVPSFLVRDCSSVFCVPLMRIFNLALKAGVFPSVWKLGKVCPVFKRGSRHEIANYRPITLLCNFSKVFESVLHTHMFKAFESVLSVRQHGFVPGRSTSTNLVLFTQFVAESIDAGLQVDTVFTDFSKAFDQIDHGIILDKLRSVGMSTSLLSLMSSYLMGRSQFVECSGFRSRQFHPSSGVPQGSNLGPLLFLIFINDICDRFTTNALLYADDLKLFREVRSVDDCRQLQRDIDCLTDWCHANKLGLNIDKCRILTFSRKHSNLLHGYQIGSVPIVRCASFRDLGVTFDSHLRFDLHVAAVVSTACRSLGFIVRSCRNFDDVSCLKLLYFAYVRSHLEYASVVWAPFYGRYVGLIESVQRKFLKFLYFRQVGNYPRRGICNSILLGRFGLQSLGLRRSVARVSFLYKVLRGGLDVSLNLDVYTPQVPIRNPRLFYLPRARTNVMLGSPVYAMCSLCNAVSGHLDMLTSPLSAVLTLMYNQPHLFLGEAAVRPTPL